METTHRPAVETPCTCGFDAWLLASEYQSMPLDESPDMDQPCEIVPDSTIPSTYVLSTATLDESILDSTGDSRVSNKQPTVSMPVTDPPPPPPPSDFSTCSLRFLILLTSMTL